LEAPAVAVVIPCHDDGSTIAEAVSSIKEQQPVEVVVVDDGSTEAETLALLAQLKSSGVNVVRQENLGPGAARTAGLAASSAPLVFVLDADDLLTPGTLEAMAAQLERHPEAGFCWGDYELFGEAGGRYRAPSGWLPWTLTYVNPYPVCSMFRRDVLERAGGWRSVGYEDWALWLTLADMGYTGVHADRVVYRRRIHGDGRRLAGDRARHRELYSRLRAQHAGLFGRRATLRASEGAPAWKRVVYPVLFGSRRFVPLAVEVMLQRLMMRRGSGLPG
jgi:glycosyltransferase involved in cell wall biosynthesis